MLHCYCSQWILTDNSLLSVKCRQFILLFCVKTTECPIRQNLPCLASLRLSEKHLPCVPYCLLACSLAIICQRAAFSSIYVFGNVSTPVLTSCILARYVPLRTRFSTSVPKTYIAKTGSSCQTRLRARTAPSRQGSVSLERLLHYGREKFFLYRTCRYGSAQKSRMN